MTQDRIKTIGRSRIQYGPFSERVYLMQLASGEAESVIAAMNKLAQAEGYTKLFAKVPARSAAVSTDAGFEIEARIPDFYADGNAAFFMSRFRCEERRRSSDAERIRQDYQNFLERLGNILRDWIKSQSRRRAVALSRTVISIVAVDQVVFNCA